MRKRALLGMLIIVSWVWVAQPGFAQVDEPTDDDVNAIAKELYCPVCENVPLDVCPTQACKQWRDTIREKLSLGWGEAEIKTYFVEQYGDRVLATPPPTGLNWLVYVLPPIVFVFGIGVLYRTFRSWRKEPVTSVIDEVSEGSQDPYLEKLEEELRKRS